MKHRLSAIALGAALACSVNAVLADPTVTTTQTGTGNRAYAEQNMVDARASAAITQIGNNNIAGDPDSHTPGILQQNVVTHDVHPVKITQIGDANRAAIIQTNGDSDYGAAITQTGNMNTASLRADHYWNSQTSITQTGNSNVANLVHLGTGGAGGYIFQNGERNVANIRNDGLNDSSTLTRQTGSDNRLDVLHNGNASHSAVHIEQTGVSNTALTIRSGGGFVSAWTLQNGNGNFAAINQATSNEGHGNITQTGNGNVASLAQVFNSNDADITQTGNLNNAGILQFGPATFSVLRNTAYITQAGNGFGALIAQSGSDNHAGIYQH